MKHLKIFAFALSAWAFTGCASQAKYEAWGQVETAKQTARAAQAEALAKVASTSQDKTLAAFAVFTMAGLKDQTTAPMPTDDGLEYLRILAPIGGNIATKAIGSYYELMMHNNSTIERMHTVDALVKTPKTVEPTVVTPVIVEVPVPAE